MQISKIIREKGSTIQEVADRIGVAKGTLASMIGASGNPTLGTLRRIADAIGCNVAEFFTDEAEDKQVTAKLVCPHCGKPLNIHID